MANTTATAKGSTAEAMDSALTLVVPEDEAMVPRDLHDFMQQLRRLPMSGDVEQMWREQRAAGVEVSGLVKRQKMFEKSDPKLSELFGKMAEAFRENPDERFKTTLFDWDDRASDSSDRASDSCELYFAHAQRGDDGKINFEVSFCSQRFTSPGKSKSKSWFSKFVNLFLFRECRHPRIDLPMKDFVERHDALLPIRALKRPAPGPAIVAPPTTPEQAALSVVGGREGRDHVVDLSLLEIGGDQDWLPVEFFGQAQEPVIVTPPPTPGQVRPVPPGINADSNNDAAYAQSNASSWETRATETMRHLRLFITNRESLWVSPGSVKPEFPRII